MFELDSIHNNNFTPNWVDQIGIVARELDVFEKLETSFICLTYNKVSIYSSLFFITFFCYRNPSKVDFVGLRNHIQWWSINLEDKSEETLEEMANTQNQEEITTPNSRK